MAGLFFAGAENNILEFSKGSPGRMQVCGALGSIYQIGNGMHTSKPIYHHSTIYHLHLPLTIQLSTILPICPCPSLPCPTLPFALPCPYPALPPPSPPGGLGFLRELLIGAKSTKMGGVPRDFNVTFCLVACFIL